MFICTFDSDMAKELDKQFKFLHRMMLDDKMIYVYVFDKELYSKFNKKDKVFIMNRLFF